MPKIIVAKTSKFEVYKGLRHLIWCNVCMRATQVENLLLNKNKQIQL